MARAKHPFAVRLEAAAESGEFGPRGAAVAATLARVVSLAEPAVRRLVEIQLTANEPDLSFYRAWAGAHERARAPHDLLTFQHIVSWAYGAADGRLATMTADAALAHPAAQAFRHAVAGRALALAAGPDAPADDLMALSKAWTTVVG